MVLEAFEQAIHSCGMPENVIHLSDRGLHYLPIRCTNRLDAAHLDCSVCVSGNNKLETLSG